MEPNQQNPYSMPAGSSPSTSPMRSDLPSSPNAGHKKTTPMIVSLVIVLVIIIAALFLLASAGNRQSAEEITPGSAANTDSVPVVNGSSDAIGDLQADLEASIQGLDGQNF